MCVNTVRAAGVKYSSMSCHLAPSQQGWANPSARLPAGKLRLQPGLQSRAEQGCIAKAEEEGGLVFAPKKTSLFITEFLIQNLGWIRNATGFTGEDILGDSLCSRCLALSSQPGKEVPCIRPTMSHHWNPAAEGEGSIFIRKVIKKEFLVENVCEKIFPAAAQLLSHGGGQVKAGWPEVPPAQVLWYVMIKFFTSDLKKTLATCFSA